jgi:hypothetical protein
MPVNKKKMAALKKEYGSQKGKNVYYALENKDKKKRHMPPIGPKGKGK